MLVLPLLIAIVPMGTADSTVVRGPIHIDGDDDLCGRPLTPVVNCGSADGSAERPYRIAGWSVSSSEVMGLSAVTIKNTTKHLVVTNNVFSTAEDLAYATVVLSNVRNVAFTGNDVTSGRASAMKVNGFHGGSINGNAIRAGLNGGATITLVDVLDAQGVRVQENTFTASSGAAEYVDVVLALSGSPEARVESNVYEITGSPGTAVHISDSPDVQVVGETILEIMVGIVINASDRAGVYNVSLERVHKGLVVTDSWSLSMSRVDLTDHYPCNPSCLELGDSIGIHATQSTLELSQVSIQDFDYGVHAANRENNALTAQNLTVTGNGIGLYVYNLGNSTVSYSNIHDNGVGVWNVGDSTMQAKHNWWGCADGPLSDACDSVEGKVKFRPYATEAYDL